jgi:hypothetical protein
VDDGARRFPVLAEGFAQYGHVFPFVLPCLSLPWLAKLDQRARRWPRPAFWGYLAVKWYLVILGAWGLLYAFSQNTITQLLNTSMARYWP